MKLWKYPKKTTRIIQDKMVTGGLTKTVGYTGTLM